MSPSSRQPASSASAATTPPPIAAPSHERDQGPGPACTKGQLLAGEDRSRPPATPPGGRRDGAWSAWRRAGARAAGRAVGFGPLALGDLLAAAVAYRVRQARGGRGSARNGPPGDAEHATRRSSVAGPNSGTDPAVSRRQAAAVASSKSGSASITVIRVTTTLSASRLAYAAGRLAFGDDDHGLGVVTGVAADDVHDRGRSEAPGSSHCTKRKRRSSISPVPVGSTLEGGLRRVERDDRVVDLAQAVDQLGPTGRA